jgi:A/G-specific adenine glycosylase
MRSLPARETKDAFQRDLLAWYQRSRRDLPWRRTRDPYAIWLSEVMLQQTRVETVIPYYERFVAAYSNVHALAEAPLEDVLRLWSGLGYYRRARMLHAAARDIDCHHGGSFPDTAAGLLEIKGIGPYTAGAVASIAWGEAVPVVDGNVARVLSRLFALEAEEGARSRDLWELAGSLVAAEDPSSWNQALMELGATVCTPRRPRCPTCPVRLHCEALARGVTDAIPRPRSRKPPTITRRVGFVLWSRGRVLLGRRPEDGLFGGMWEPPHGEDRDVGEEGRALVTRARGRVRDAGRVTHVLSHRRIEMTIYVGRVDVHMTSSLRRCFRGYDTVEWVRRSDLSSVALSTLARKVLSLSPDPGERQLP